MGYPHRHAPLAILLLSLADLAYGQQPAFQTAAAILALSFDGSFHFDSLSEAMDRTMAEAKNANAL